MEFYKDKTLRKVYRGEDSTLENKYSQIVFESSIRKICIHDGKMIILTNEKITKNIYCLNEQLNLLWQIGSSRYDIESEKDKLSSHYIDINLEGEHIIAKNFSDFEVIIDIENGRILKEKIAR
jgi:hypothetical protein